MWLCTRWGLGDRSRPWPGKVKEGRGDELILGHQELKGPIVLEQRLLGSCGSPGSAIGREAWWDFVFLFLFLHISVSK